MSLKTSTPSPSEDSPRERPLPESQNPPARTVKRGEGLRKYFPGYRNNRLVMIEYIRYNVAIWRCDCGVIKQMLINSVSGGNSRSCGCIQKEVAADRKRTHGMHQSREYRSWNKMKQRCINPKNDHFKHYGGRGIIVCDRWRDSFDAFFADMGMRPIGMELDRRDVNGNYDPGNCRWATRTQQMNNTRVTTFITHNGITLPVQEWNRKAGLPRNMVSSRLRLGWTMEKALSTPPTR